VGSWINEIAEAIAAGDDAVFDADGTLWEGDVGEAIHAHFVREGVLARATLDEYARRHEQDFADAYVYATKILAGLEEGWLTNAARAFFDAVWAAHVFPEMKALITALSARGVCVWIASASNRWVVEAGAARLGIDRERVLAMAVRVEGGRLTADVVPPPITRAGKAEALRQHLSAAPALVAGNSVNDIDMLCLASKVALVVYPASAGDDPKDAAFLEEARRRRWRVQALSAPGFIDR
jgi:phosphoserine phosphatase